MWLCLNNAYLSIVYKECADDELLVRARRPGDIERIFPDAKVVRSPSTDYLFRARVPRLAVAEAVAVAVAGIDYSNFKDSVKDGPLHDGYMGVWTAMSRLQPTPPYGVRRRRTYWDGLDDDLEDDYSQGALL